MSIAAPGSGTLPAMARAIATTIVVAIPVFLVGGLAVQIGADLHFSAAGTGLATGAYFAAAALTAVPSGALVERFGARRVSRYGIALSAASLIAIGAAAHSLASLIALLVLGALGNAMGQLAGNASLSRRVPVRRQGLAFGLKQASIPACTLLAGAAVPAVALTLGWRWAFVAAGLLCLPVLAVPPDDAVPSRKERQRVPRPILILGVAAAIGSSGANALGAFVPLSAVSRGVSPQFAGVLLTVGSAVCVVARVAGGWQADLRPDSQVGVIAALMACGSAGLLFLSFSGTATMTWGVVLGFGFGWSWPGLLNFAVVRLHPQAPAAASSVTLTGAQAGACLGPLGLGTVAQTVGYTRMWTIASVALAIGALLMVAASRALMKGS
ncbi:MFS transporter [Actinoplanes sp. NPDC051851]|uniref:MFS transporter n=1 Tax=Actinoplanes sp. NPDC051851 TaxID=3154753 RepID=UPI00344A0566